MKIICGIVLYNSQINRLLEEFDSIINQVDEICLFDNGSDNIGEVENQVINKFHSKKVTLLKSKKNLGIGAALNRIFEYAESHNYDWVLTLDHDSVCPNDMVKNYTDIQLTIDVGMICPNIIDRGMATYYYSKIDAEKPFEYIKRTIQSGAMVSTKCWKDVNGFDETMFIDFVDFDFCERLLIHGYKIVKVNSVELDHELGRKEKTLYAYIFKKLYEKTGKRFFLYFTYKNVFSNDRCYYSARNNVIFIKRYKKYLNNRKENFDCFDRIIRKILRSKNRTKVFLYSLKGIIDGMRYEQSDVK